MTALPAAAPVRRPSGLDPELAALFAATATDGVAPSPITPGDWQAQRQAFTAFYDALARHAVPDPTVQMTPYTTRATDGTTLALRWYRPAAATSGAAVVFAHGGGMISGTLDHYDALVRTYVQASGVPFLAVDYRLAPEAQGRQPVEDVFAGLSWLRDQAAMLGIEPARIALMGDSAGGGLAAGVAILARERQVALAQQLLLYPMLDDRICNQPLEARLHGAPVLVYEASYTGWKALLGQEPGAAARQDPAIVPARLTDYAGLAPAYVEAADLDAFRNEDMEYARRLAQAGVPVEFHLYPGVSHGFDLVAPQAGVTQRAMQNRLRVLRAL